MPIAAASLALAACGGAETSASVTATETTTVDRLGPNGPVAADGVSCADVGGVFEAHGTDGRGSCIPADQRAHCHVPPAQQDGNYVAELMMQPPFPNGKISRGELVMLDGASNADCWHLPAG
ncbi:hypothetical protein [Nocardia pseudovaccinii]|uniref:hypothetical protein n=1 Tax=Nocardia pseudovaccinii TaxID=189540 RepID=UPI0012F4C3C0|nr:hypothetical protein [Nocardia pseudovaccinii]